jgi:subtilisin family serine protease
VPGELIVVFEKHASQGQRGAALAQAGARPKKAFPQIGAALVEVDRNRPEAAVRALARHPHVSYVQPNHVYTTMAVPDDPSFGQLWGLENTGQTGGTVDADIDAATAWDATTGSADVVVGVTDTGVDFAHPDLAAQQWVNTGENCGSSDPAAVCAQRTDGVDNDADGLVDDWRGWDWVGNDNDPFDDNSHGTHVAGTIGAVGDNATGVAGVSWDVRIMALKFLNAAGSGTTANAIAATLYAADHGASVVNNSWGGGPFDQALLDAVEYGAARGMLFVAAAGNSGLDIDASPSYPASYDSDAVVSVAATDHNDTVASFSNIGRASVDLGAPGVNIFSTTPNATYGSKSGTSMATPHVSGAAALLAARFPGATPSTVKALLLSSVDPNASLASRSLTGGRLNAGAAASCSDAPVAWLLSPSASFGAGLGDTVEIEVVGGRCALPVGVGNVAVTVNSASVPLTASSPDSGVYRGTYAASAEGSLTVTATVTVGGTSATDVAVGTVVRNFSCQEIPADGWVDATPYTNLGINLGSFKTIVMPFPFTFYGQTYTTVNVSSYGFLSFGTSSAGPSAQVNTGIPNSALPNGLVAPFWDDLNPGVFGGGRVYGVWSGSPPDRRVTFEWYQVPHTLLVGAATFEATLYESGEIRFRYQDTDFGTAQYNAGASATVGVESPNGTVGRQFSFNQAVLTNGKTVACVPSTPPPPEPPAITTTELDDGTVGAPYTELLAAAGGTPPYTWSIDAGQLPDGLALDAATGVLSGTPTDSGVSPFTVRVTDAASQSSTAQFEITVAHPLEIPPDSLPAGVVGQAYNAFVAGLAGAAPYTWSVVAGSLPPGLALDPGTSTVGISGMPATAGTFTFTLQATDAGSPARTATQEFSIAVLAPLAITTTSLAGGTVGQPYSQLVAASGGAASYAWSVVAGSVPPGLTLTSGTPSATLTGTPTTVGSYTFTAEVTDGSQTDQQELTVVVVAAPAPTIAVTSVAYSTAGGSAGTRDLLVRVTVTFGGPAGGATVRLNLRRDGASYGTKNATTVADGVATFRFNRYPAGCYTSVVVRVTYLARVYTPSTPANSHCK